MPTNPLLPALPDYDSEDIEITAVANLVDHKVDLKFTELEAAVKDAMIQSAQDELSGSEILYSTVAAIVIVAIRDLVGRTFRWVKSHWS